MNERPQLEICVDSLGSVMAAAAGGADRIELCANLPEGGTTPSAGLIRVARERFRGGLMVLIRARGYDFLYTDDELRAMEEDIRVARDLGVDGIVIGCLTADGRVDRAACERLLAAGGSLDVTFHRAFDMSCDLGAALEDIAGLGIRRVLTSGGCADVIAGQNVLAGLVRRSAGRVSIMPGGGVTEDNAAALVAATGVHELHLSARHEVRSGMRHRNEGCSMGVFSKGREYEWRETSAEKVRLARAALLAGVSGR